MLGDRANIVCLYKILEKYSDEEHILSMSDITGYFMQDYGMKIDRPRVIRNSGIEPHSFTGCSHLPPRAEGTHRAGTSQNEPQCRQNSLRKG